MLLRLARPALSEPGPEGEALAHLAAAEEEATSEPVPAGGQASQRVWDGPPGFLARRRVRAVLGTHLLTLPAGAVVCALASWPWWVALAPIGLTLCVLMALWVDARTWARRLPYRVVGLDRIAGAARREDDWEPLIAFEVRLTLLRAGPEDAVALPVAHALAILGARVDRLNRRDPELRRGGEPAWQAQGLSVVGRSHLGVYREAVLERWLRRELRLLHRLHPVATVEVCARFTGVQLYLAAGAA